jgi:hypothetical protein
LVKLSPLLGLPRKNCKHFHSPRLEHNPSSTTLSPHRPIVSYLIFIPYLGLAWSYHRHYKPPRQCSHPKGKNLLAVAPSPSKLFDRILMAASRALPRIPVIPPPTGYVKLVSQQPPSADATVRTLMVASQALPHTVVTPLLSVTRMAVSWAPRAATRRRYGHVEVHYSLGS